ncbi:unnamed protein product, partial [Mesorhabditis belari]|uniref:VWFA domain-containing protein n=1 Tax=Mesorhabditis belari TaxID=2138241 RepID=A0AAF3J648_9BILA
MVYSAELGYDPDEWEECEEEEKFMVFSQPVRILLSAMAITFAYFFFRMVDKNAKKDEEEGKEKQPFQESESIVSQVLGTAMNIVGAGVNLLNGPESRPMNETAREMFDQTKEAVYSGAQQAKELSRDFAEATRSAVDEAYLKAQQRAGNLPQLQQTPQQVERLTQQAEYVQQIPQKVSHFTEEAQPSLQRKIDEADAFMQKFGAQLAALPQQLQEMRGEVNTQQPLSREEQAALLEWEAELSRVEADRLAKLEEKEVGGETSSGLSTDESRAIDKLLPASHISMYTSSDSNHEKSPLEQKLMSEIKQLQGEGAQSPHWDRHSILPSDVESEISVGPGRDGSSPTQDVQFKAAHLGQPRASTDSDDFVKVSVDQLRITPPEEKKPITAEEAAQLQALIQEYDMGTDATPLATPQLNQRAAFLPVKDDSHLSQASKTSEEIPINFVDQRDRLPFEAPTSKEEQEVLMKQMEEMYGVQQSPFESFHVQVQINPPQQSLPQEIPIEQPQNKQEIFGQQQQQRQQNVSETRASILNDDPRRLAEADMFVDDAIEYLANQKNQPQQPQQQQQPTHPHHSPNISGFVIEEEMLSSQGDRPKPQPIVRMPSGEATSALIKTNEVFDKMEHDDHDDMTYAPEIQSVEIPPDQMSESSENFQEIFDRIAAESQQLAQFDSMRPQGSQQVKANRKPSPNEEPPSSDVEPPRFGTQSGSAPVFLSPSSGRRKHKRHSPSNLLDDFLVLSEDGLSLRVPSPSELSQSSDGQPRVHQMLSHLRKQSSLLSIMGVTSLQELLLSVTSLEALSNAMAKAGLESTNLIFGIDYTASNKYQGEDSFGGKSLHTIHPSVKNPYQQVITILGRTLAPFASTNAIPVYGFGDAKTSDWSVFPLKAEGDCRGLEEVLKVYNDVTPTVDLSGPTNFAPLIYQAIEICQRIQDYHILVIIADGQVTNEKATRRAIVQACQYPLSIIVVGVGDGPWDMMRVFDESLPKRAWDNFHFVEFHEIMKCAQGDEADVKIAVHSLLEIPDQYRCICKLGLVKSRTPHGSQILQKDP